METRRLTTILPAMTLTGVHTALTVDPGPGSPMTSSPLRGTSASAL
jgi:hypothetical protein